MRYFNKDGEPIRKQVWERLIRHRKYVNIATSMPPGQSVVYVVTSWLGVASDTEDPPKTFVTIASEEVVAGQAKARKALHVLWSSSVDQAMERHKEALSLVEARK